MQRVRFLLLYLLELDMMEKNGGIVLPHVYNSNVSQPMGCEQKSPKCCCTVKVIKDESVRLDSFQEPISIMLFKGSGTFISPKGYENACIWVSWRKERGSKIPTNKNIQDVLYIIYLVQEQPYRYKQAGYVVIQLLVSTVEKHKARGKTECRE